MRRLLVLAGTLLAGIAASGQQARAPMGTGPWNPPQEGKLAAGESTTFPVRIQEGVDYIIHGLCDEDCNLMVRDPLGETLDEDAAMDPVPVLLLTAAVTGLVNVEVSCPVDACEWSVRTEEKRTGSLDQRGRVSIPLVLQNGMRYRVSGTCDSDCDDLDLLLRSPSGKIVAEDTLPDNYPVLLIEPDQGGEFALVVEMVECSVEPCYWQVMASPES